MAQIPESHGLYRPTVANDAGLDHGNAAITKMTLMEAHQKLGHAVCAAVKSMVSKGLVTGIEIDSNSKEEFCEPCAKAKAARKPFPKESHTRASRFGERVHWDLWGPAAVRSLGGKSYAVCRTDDYSREVEIYFIAKKSEVFQTYKKDEALIETQHDGAKIKMLCCDRGG